MLGITCKEKLHLCCFYFMKAALKKQLGFCQKKNAASYSSAWPPAFIEGGEKEKRSSKR